MKRYFTLLKEEFRGYCVKSLTADLLAGITVAAVALPLALAFGVSSGADAASGLITAIIAGVVISLLSGGFYQISGPTGAMAAILMGLVAKYSMQGVFAATFMAGALLLLAGIFKLGRLTSFIPMPVISGFTSGIAVIIALGQVDNFFGVASQGSTAVEKLLSYGTLGFAPNWTAVGVGMFVILLMVFYPKKWNAVVPSSLVGIILATAGCIIFSLDVKTVGAIPQTLMPENRFDIASLDLNVVKELISPAISIAMLGMIESLLCGASAGRMTGKRLDSDQELVAQGIGNMLLPFFGGIPATAAIARTSVAIKAGARTRVTGIVHALALLAFMLLLAPVMSMIPLCALAGVLMVTAWRMNEWHVIKYILKNKFVASAIMFFATMIATIVFDLTIAIFVGVGIAIVYLLSRLSKLDIKYAPIDLSRMPAPLDTAKNGHDYSRSMTVYISGPIMFANGEQIEEIYGRVGDCDRVFVSMRGVSDMDISGAQAMTELVKKLIADGKKVVFCGLTKRVRVMFKRSGIENIVGGDSIYWSVDRAIMDDHGTPIN